MHQGNNANINQENVQVSVVQQNDGATNIQNVELKVDSTSSSNTVLQTVEINSNPSTILYKTPLIDFFKTHIDTTIFTDEMLTEGLLARKIIWYYDFVKDMKFNLLNNNVYISPFYSTKRHYFNRKERKYILMCSIAINLFIAGSVSLMNKDTSVPSYIPTIISAIFGLFSTLVITILSKLYTCECCLDSCWARLGGWLANVLSILTFLTFVLVGAVIGSMSGKGFVANWFIGQACSVAQSAFAGSFVFAYEYRKVVAKMRGKTTKYFGLCISE